MHDPKSSATNIAKSWDAYWRGALDAGAYTGGGLRHPAARSFWLELFREIGRVFETPRIVDIGSGDGAVVECASAALADQHRQIVCVDISAAAVDRAKRRVEGVWGLVADARAMPLCPGAFATVTSQFGLEYAGLEALPEVARLVAPGGRLAMLLHIRRGGIYRESAAGLDAISRLQRAQFLPRARRMFETGFAACRGAPRRPYEAAAARLQPAYRTLESIMREHGQHVAGDTVLRLHEDVERIQRELRDYEPAEVLHWLARMDVELQTYVGRMASMCEAALDDDSFADVCAELRGGGYTMRTAEALAVSGAPLPLAWALVAERA